MSHPPPAQQLPTAQQPLTAQATSPAPTAEDWPEEGLVAPEQPILAAIADAQLVVFSRVSDPDPDPYPDPDWICIKSDHWIRIRIRNLNTDPDPDPGGQK